MENADEIICEICGAQFENTMTDTVTVKGHHYIIPTKEGDMVVCYHCKTTIDEIYPESIIPSKEDAIKVIK